MLNRRPTFRQLAPGLTALLLFAACGGGGSSSGSAASCADGVRNGTETDVDCGGDACDPCALGSTCDAETDCASNLCRARRCVSPASCEDGVRNNGETAIDCGGPECNPCKDGQACDRSSDCESLLCSAGSCAVPECGDGVTQAQNDEECDDRRETAACNANCTVSACGDGIVNASAGEFCEPEGMVRVYSRCNDACTYGSGLDGTFGTEWEELAAPAGDGVPTLQSFVHAGSRYIYEFYLGARYDIQENTWQTLTSLVEDPAQVAFPTSDAVWANAAAGATSLWVPRGGKMYRFDMNELLWTEAATDIPDGLEEYSAAVFDGEGNVWYHGPDDLVRFTPSTGEFKEFPHDPFNVWETRLAYDPITNRIAFGGYQATRLMIFDLESEEFTESSDHPKGWIRDNACQDRAGGMYTGSSDGTTMHRYDFATDTWSELPELPKPHDNWASCVVSADGYLYYPTTEYVEAQSDYVPFFYRLPLGKH